MSANLFTRCITRFSPFKFHRALFTSSIKRTSDISDISDDLTPQDTQNILPIESLGHQSLPIITSRKLEFPNKYVPAKQAWLETLSSLEDVKQGIIDLHPDIFSTHPRIDVLHNNVKWQRNYKRISYAKTRSRGEILERSNKKPWPQKGFGKARHSAKKSPIWKGGGNAHGPRGPKSYFYMLPRTNRVLGLRIALSVKFAQGDLHVVDSLNIPNNMPEYMRDLVDTRFWGFSCLFVDDTDEMPKNICQSLKGIKEFNLMPVYGLNVYSMLKHETLILTLAAVEKIEKKLLHEIHKIAPPKKYMFNDRYDEW